MFALLAFILNLMTAARAAAAGLVPRPTLWLPRLKRAVARHANEALGRRLAVLLSTVPGGSWSAASAAAVWRYGPTRAMALATASPRRDPRRWPPAMKT
jgi:hypothetical protein